MRLASGRVLLAFDFDGTLAPIVSHPAQATMTARTRRLLRAVARRYPCAVISGRQRHELRRLVAGVPLVAAVGSHGAEPFRSAPPIGTVEDWSRRIERVLAAHPGIMVEKKRAGLALHYRRAGDKRRARAAILAAAARMEGARLLQGHDVVELVPQTAPTKGDALLALRQGARAEASLYVGDDATDEDAFRCDLSARLVSVRVGDSASSAARFVLPDQAGIDDLLAALLALRRGAAAPAEMGRAVPPQTGPFLPGHEAARG